MTIPFVSVILLCNASAVQAQDCLELDQYLHYAQQIEEPQGNQMLISGDRLFLRTAGHRLRILELVDGTAEFRGEWQSNNAIQGMCVEGDLLALSTNSTVVFFDVSDPASPDSIGRLFMPEVPRDLFIENQRLIVGSFNQGLHMADISDPSQAQLIWSDSWIGMNSGMVRTAGHLAVLDLIQGLRLFEFGADSLSALATLPDLGIANAIQTLGDTITVNGVNGTILIDTQDPAQPQVLGTLTDQHWSRVLRHNDLLFLISGSAVEVRDFANPLAPELLLMLGLSGARDLLVHDDQLWIAGSQGISTLDLQSLQVVPQLAGLDLFGGSRRILKLDDYYLLTRTQGATTGLSAIDLSATLFPTEAGAAFNLSNTTEICTAAGHAYVSSTQGIAILDIEFPWTPLVVGELLSGESQLQLQCTDSLLYVLDSQDRLSVYGLQNPVFPQLLNTIDFEQNPTVLKICDDRLIILFSQFGCRLYSLSDPLNPVETGAFEFTLPRFGIYCDTENDQLWLANAAEGLHCLDIDDSGELQLVSRTMIAGNFNNADRVGNHLYIASGVEGLLVYNVEDPASPVAAGAYFESGVCSDVIAESERIISVWGEQDLILHLPQCDELLDTPTQPSQLVQSLELTIGPNPFNPVTRIQWQQQKPGPVTLTVFNLQGAKVRSLQNSSMPAGQHRIHFDASGLASGIYIVQLEAAGAVIRSKILLLK